MYVVDYLFWLNTKFKNLKIKDFFLLYFKIRLKYFVCLVLLLHNEFVLIFRNNKCKCIFYHNVINANVYFIIMYLLISFQKDFENNLRKEVVNVKG